MASPSWPQTEALITATFESPVGEPERFIEESCTDSELREGLIALIKKHSRSPQANVAASTTTTSAGLTAGTEVGPYVVVDRIGHGGMGEVFLARDPRLDRLVALKCVLSRETDGAELRNRIIFEARAAARVTHPGIAAVHDVVEHDGRTFIVMEYVEGQSLASMLRGEAMPIARVVEIGCALADALGAAHRVGIIHRDLKPANVQVTRDGSVKILDFGIAMAIASVTTNRTQTDPGRDAGQRMNQGTPPYMSPEQLLGLPVDQRTDIFSLAVVLFEMATGRRPFESFDPLDVLLASVRRAPLAHRVDSRVPPSLSAVIEQGLSANPGTRYQTAADMARALELVRHELVPAKSDRIEADHRSRTSRRTVVTTLAIAVPVVLWALGWIMTAAFNNTLGRVGAFASEPARSYVVWGARSLIAPFVYATLAVSVLWIVRFLLGLGALSRSIARIERRVATAWNRLVRRLSLDEPLVFEPCLVTLGVVALVVVAWQFHALMGAWGSNISTTPADNLRRLGPANEDEKILYRAVLTLLFLFFTAGVIHASRLRARRPTARWGSFAASVAIVVSILLLNEVPYRILWQNQAPRISYDGMRCYLIGTSGPSSLIFCPDSNPPRNRVVRNNDPLIHSSGIPESIFSTATPQR